MAHPFRWGRGLRSVFLFFGVLLVATATKRFMNWTGVVFTPVSGSGSAVTFTGVESVRFNAGGSLAKFAGDADRYSSTVVNDFNEPTADVVSADCGAAGSIGVGTHGTLVATHNDAGNGTGVGAITYTFICVCAHNGFQGAHRQFGKATVGFVGYAADGVTNPLSSSVSTGS